MKPKRVILLEFNELCPGLLDQWIGRGLLPNFSTFYRESQVFVTQADVTDPMCLEPWSQWYSIHTGLSFEQDKVFHLTDGPGVSHGDIWQVLIDHGKSIWNCSSMNARRIAR